MIFNLCIRVSYKSLQRIFLSICSTVHPLVELLPLLLLISSSSPVSLHSIRVFRFLSSQAHDWYFQLFEKGKNNKIFNCVNNQRLNFHHFIYDIIKASIYLNFETFIHHAHMNAHRGATKYQKTKKQLENQRKPNGIKSMVRFLVLFGFWARFFGLLVPIVPFDTYT